MSEGKPRYGMTAWRIGHRHGKPAVHGVVHGREGCEGRMLHSSWIVGAVLAGESLSVETENSVYACPLRECSCPESVGLLAEASGCGLTRAETGQIEAAAREACRARKRAEAAEVAALLPGRPSAFVYMEFDTRADYYFRRMLVRSAGGDFWLSQGEEHVHVGMFQDSVLLGWPDVEGAGFRYFPYAANRLEFYTFAEDGDPVYVANCAESEAPLEVDAPCGHLLLPPGAVCEASRRQPSPYLIGEPTVPPVDKHSVFEPIVQPDGTVCYISPRIDGESSPAGGDA